MNKIQSLIYAIKLIVHTEPKYIFWSIPQILINSVLLILYVYAPKLIIEKLTDGSLYPDVLKVIFTYIVILLLLNLLNTILKHKSELTADRFSKKLSYEIGVLTMSLNLCDIESTSVRDTINLAKNTSSLTTAMSLFQKMMSNVLSVVGLSYIIIQLDFIFLVAVAAVVGLKAFFSYLQYKYTKRMRIIAAQNDREGNYLYGIAYYNHGGAKEIRVNNLHNWFMDKIKKYRYKMVSMQYGNFKYMACFEIIIAISVALQSILVLFILSEAYINGNLSIADFTMYFTAVFSLTNSLSALTEDIGKNSMQTINVIDYKKLLDMHQNKKDDNKGISVFKIVEIEFKNVSFNYPGNDFLVLDDISITITDKEKLLIVGMNGAGKSTFIKLLCKFYKPTSGRITINGVDIWDIPNECYYKLITAVFQDYENFAFSLYENVTLTESYEYNKVSEILSSLDMKHLTSNPDLLDGIELSGGEGQIIAIARAIYKDSNLLILDEPTASLDVKAESEIYKDFFRLAKEKTTIFISHRLACASVVDNIAVFNEGKIVEYGSHDVLISINGLYAQMYKKQSEPFIIGGKNV